MCFAYECGSVECGEVVIVAVQIRCYIPIRIFMNVFLKLCFAVFSRAT